MKSKDQVEKNTPEGELAEPEQISSVIRSLQARERKIRAWHQGKMLYRGLFDRNWYATEKNDDDGCHCVGGIAPDDKYTHNIMYDINRKDETGKLIYEGDIFEVTDGDGWVVGYQIAELSEDTLSIHDQCIGKVIGNVYENPKVYKERI